MPKRPRPKVGNVTTAQGLPPAGWSNLGNGGRVKAVIVDRDQ